MDGMDWIMNNKDKFVRDVEDKHTRAKSILGHLENRETPAPGVIPRWLWLEHRELDLEQTIGPKRRN